MVRLHDKTAEWCSLLVSDERMKAETQCVVVGLFCQQ
jgi:hypothetical protein